MSIPLTSIKVRFEGEDWTWVTFTEGPEGSILTSDERLTAKWQDDKLRLTFKAHANLDVEDQTVLLFPEPKRPSALS